MASRYQEGFNRGFKKAQAEGQVEIDKLREALERIIDDIPWAEQIARQALREIE